MQWHLVLPTTAAHISTPTLLKNYRNIFILFLI